MNRVFLTVLAAGAALSLAACERIAVEGRATDVRGEALPGVVVRLAGSDEQDLTDGLGRYRVRAAREAVTARLEFSKSGYAPGELTVRLAGRLRVLAPEAALWPLPQNPGVYVLAEHRYVQTDWVLPKQYYLQDGSAIYGAELPAKLRATADGTAPFVVCYRTPRYNARLSRLAPADATVPGPDAEPIQIWVESGTIGAALAPVDQPKGNLLRIAVDRPLDPGVYGVHWGATEGYTTLESRVFVFRVPDPPRPAAGAEAAEGDGESASSDAAPQAPANEEASAPPAAAAPTTPVSPPPAQQDAIEPPTEEPPPQRR